MKMKTNETQIQRVVDTWKYFKSVLGVRKGILYVGHVGGIPIAKGSVECRITLYVFIFNLSGIFRIIMNLLESISDFCQNISEIFVTDGIRVRE